MRLFAFAACLSLTPVAGAQTLPDSQPVQEESLAAWRVETSRMNSSDTRDTQTRMARYGRDWASWVTQSDGHMWLDLSQSALFAQAADQDVVVRTSLYAEARRHLDIYVALSEGGRRDVISFGNAGTFDRVWLEAATGVASQSGALDMTDTPTGFIALYDDQVVFSADYGGEGSRCNASPLEPAFTASALAWLPYVAPIHPDIMARLSDQNLFPCAFSFVVYSPDSPSGRMERWSIQSEPGEAERPALPPLPEDSIQVYAGADRLSAVMTAAIDTLNGANGDGPDTQSFFEESQRLQEEGDYAGALLVQIQETHHFGPCPEASIGSARLTCAYASALALSGRDDTAFQNLAAGLEALERNNAARAVELFAPFIDREGRSGAAARLLTANALISWGRVGLQARPDLDPAQLLAEALMMDPFAPDAYWHLGQRYLAAGAPAPAWSLFDLGRKLPRPIEASPLAEADTLETRMSDLAPYWLPQPQTVQ